MIINMNGAKAPETPSPILQEKTVTPQTLPTVIGADEGYDGLSQVTVNPDTNLKAENIRSGKTIFGVDGTFVGTEVQGQKFTELFNKTITSLTAEDLAGVSKIPNYICEQCHALTELSLPDTVTEIGMYSFYNCYSLETLTLTKNLRVIRNYGFAICQKLTSLTLPPGCSITDGALSSTGLISFVFPERTTYLATFVLGGCKSLRSVTVPSTVTEIYEQAFDGCSALTSLIMEPTSPPRLGGNALRNTSANLVITVPKGSLEAYQTAYNWSRYADKMVEATE